MIQKSAKEVVSAIVAAGDDSCNKNGLQDSRAAYLVGYLTVEMQDALQAMKDGPEAVAKYLAGFEKPAPVVEEKFQLQAA